MANAYVTTLTLEHNFRDGDPLSNAHLTNKYQKLKQLQLLLNAIVTGRTVPGVIAHLGTAAASATATFSSTGPSAADTVTVNGVAFTATQFHATGTVTAASIANNDTVTVNGTVYTAKTTLTSPSVTTEFVRGGTDTADAAALAAAITANGAGVYTANSAAAVVTVRAASAGTAGNAITLASSNNSRLAVSGATLANGAARGTNQFDFTGTLAQTAVSLANGIIGSATAKVVNTVTATASGAVTTIKAIQKGLLGNLFTLTKSGANIAVTGAGFLAGGTESTFTMT